MLDCRTSCVVQWSNLDLTALLEDEDSCVHFERVKKHLGLHPFHLTDLNAALREILNTNLNFYDSELNGLVLAYKNPKLLSPLGDILYDTCFVHVDVEADFYIFKPEVGRSLRGFVNKIGTNHINILVHKIFNVSVPKPTEEGEEEDENWPGHKVKIGQEVRFTVEEINFNISKLPYIRGSFNEEEYLRGCKLFNEEIAITCDSEFQDITRQSFNRNINKKIKSENKKITFNTDSEGDDVNEIGEDQKPIVSKLKNKPVIEKQPVASSSQESSKKRKRKSSESDNQQSDKEEKKPKVHLNNADDTQFAVPENSPKKRKKKKTLENDRVEEEDEKKQKLLIHNLPEDSVPQCNDNDASSKKKHRKKKHKTEEETDDERKHKLTIKTVENHESSTSKKTDDSSLKKLKKRNKKTSESVETEDEKAFKSTIIKNLDYDAAKEASESEFPKKRNKKTSESVETEDEKAFKSTIVKNLDYDAAKEASVSEFPKKRNKKTSENVETEDEKAFKSTIVKNLDYDAANEASESESPKTKSRKRKRSVIVDADDANETEDEKKYKASLKKQIVVNNTEGEFQVPQEPPKKRKKVHKTREANDTEDERKYKKSLIKQLSQLDGPEVSSENQFKVPINISINDDILMDTEDERRYKSSLKVLVKTMQNGEEGEQPVERKKKKHKKKHKSADLESAELNSPIAKVKEEPTDDKKSKKSSSGEDKQEQSNPEVKEVKKDLKMEKHKDT